MSINRFNNINIPINSALQSTPEHYVPPFEFGIEGRGMYDYQWIYVTGCIAAFAMAFGIGANDVANNFATSVGSRTLKMWQALVIAGVCEFLGAYLLGARVTSTIKDGIVNIGTFQGHDDLFMFGMLCSLIVVSIWLMVATYVELPVSTTHSIIGAVVGFALCSPGGGDAVDWGGIGLIVASWFVSPLLSSVIAATMFFFVRRFILRMGDKAYNRTFTFFPGLVFFTFTINLIFIMQKGGISDGQGVADSVTLSEGALVGIAFGVGAGLGLLTILIFNPCVRRMIDGMSDEAIHKRYVEVTGMAATPAPAAAEPAAAEVDPESRIVLEGAPVAAENVSAANPRVASSGCCDEEQCAASNPAASPPSIGGRIEAKLDWLFSQDKITRQLDATNKVATIHSNAELFPIKAELVFGYLQVFTAMFASFAHGANDVANAIGPLAGIVAVYNEGVGGATSKAPVQDWILVLGGAGIVVGLAVLGHVIIAAVGVKLVKITPSRGFCMELSTALVIALGSFLGIPLSSTQVAIGSIVGVGLTEGNWREAVNGKFLVKIFSGWVFTLVVAGSFTALVYSFATFSPSQVYPLSAHNCIAFYAQMKNTSQGDPTTYTQHVDAQGTIAGMYGFPVSGEISRSL